MRINKYLAHAGLASRREADFLIAQKKVQINGQPAVVGQKISADDKVKLVGKKEIKTYLAYYKGRGIITHSPAPGEVDISERLAKDYQLKHVTPVGRLDKDSEGLIILSDDGRITKPLLDPKSNHEKEYVVMVDKPVTPHFIRLMEQGVKIENYRTKPAKAEASKNNNKLFFITLTEGKKHQIRRMCVALGYQVQSLKRVRIMNIKLGKLKPNQYRKLSGSELENFLTELGVTS